MKRRILTVVLFLAAGAIVNVAVAWGCVQLDVTWGEWLVGRIEKSDVIWSISIERRTGAQRIRSTAEAAHLLTVSNIDVIQEYFLLQVPRWSKVNASWHPLPATSQEFIDFEREDARGWPALSMRSSFDLDAFEFKRALEQRTGVAVTDERITSPEFIESTGLSLAPGDCTRNGILVQEPTTGDDFRCLPFCPIWPGFAINTVFYATILWGLFAALFALRRRRRIKRGLCVNCAYDLRKRPNDSSACPECGTPVT